MNSVGKASIYGLGNASILYDAVATLLGDRYINESSWEDDFSVDYLLTINGNTSGFKVCDRKFHVNIMFTPIGLNSTKAQSMTARLRPFTKVRLSGFPSMYNGYYNYEGGMKVSQSSTGRTIVIVSLVSFDIMSANQIAAVNQTKI